MALTIAVIVVAGCDQTESFTFVNKTQLPLIVSYSQLEKGGDPRPLGEGAYNLGPDQSVNTQDERSISGDRGGEIFNKHHFLRVAATNEGAVVFDKTYTFEEMKRLDFRVEIEQ